MCNFYIMHIIYTHIHFYNIYSHTQTYSYKNICMYNAHKFIDIYIK